MFFRKKKDESPPASKAVVEEIVTAQPARAEPTPPAPTTPAATKLAATKSVQAPAAPVKTAAPVAQPAKPAVVTGRMTAAPEPVDERALDPAEREKFRRGAAQSKRISTGFGEIVSVLMRSKTHANLPLAQLQTLLPAVATSQYITAEVRSRETGLTTTIAVVIWANVTDDVDRRLSADVQKPLSLAPAEWSGGPNVWVVEAVGDGRAVSALIKRLHETQWKGQTVKVRARGEDGQATIKSLSAPA